MLDSFAAVHPAEVERAEHLYAAGTLLRLRERTAALDEVLTVLA